MDLLQYLTSLETGMFLFLVIIIQMRHDIQEPEKLLACDWTVSDTISQPKYVTGSYKFLVLLLFNQNATDK